MWIAKRRVLTVCGWVDSGRVVDDGDPMLDGVEDAFERLDPAPVETATAAPGEVRRTTRRKAGE